MTTLGVIIGNRDFFPDSLITEGRKELLGVLDELRIGFVVLDDKTVPLGAVVTWEHAKACSVLFRQHTSEIDGILISLPNFGDEKDAVDSINLSGLNVPTWCRRSRMMSTNSTWNGGAMPSAAKFPCAITCTSTIFPSA